ncbi:hypothetical protein AVO44_15795 [Ruegeria profundi]|uniref:Uncharacterized protein n=1 Tax=Ruegeria profundi TaxID=1685378 RepID=A0A0X3TPX2_9RHOB|nr:hypothetical protein AVO44_15795 [Ruegeria profundi]
MQALWYNFVVRRKDGSIDIHKDAYLHRDDALRALKGKYEDKNVVLVIEGDPDVIYPAGIDKVKC